MKLESHKLADIFPMIRGDEFDSLKADIKENGLLESIVLYEGLILDGRNRYQACVELGIEIHTNEYIDNDPLGFVLSLNLHRRHLKADQRAAIAVELMPAFEAQAKEMQGARTDLDTNNIGAKLPQSKPVRAPKASENAAKELHVSGRYVSDMKKIKQDDPETFNAIKSGEKKLTDVKKEKSKIERVEKINEISQGNEELDLSKTYPVIYADPPWKYDHSKSDTRKIENHYPTMEIDDICAMPVSDIAAKDAILFLWTTSPKLEQGLKVVNAWGFNYITCAIWDKQKKGLGYYFRQNHEILLIGKRGNIPAPEPENRPDSIVSIPKEKHSAKPHEFYEIIEKMYPEFSKIELFCRAPRDGWSVWGNQS